MVFAIIQLGIGSFLWDQKLVDAFLLKKTQQMQTQFEHLQNKFNCGEIRVVVALRVGMNL